MSSRAAVTITPRPLWLLGLASRILRVLLCLTAAVGIAVTARNTIAPARPVVSVASRPDLPDAGAEAFAVLFARRYLTWNAGNPVAYEQGLAPFGAALPANAGVTLPSSGMQQVQWTQIVQARDDGSGGHVYTVAAQTDAVGLLYLTVPVRRAAGGRLALNGYPAFVGAPATAAFTDPQGALADVADVALEQIATRALRNYLAGADSNLAADLTSDARVSLPPLALTFGRMTRLSWARGGASVRAELVATDSRGTAYTLGYQLDVRRADARWEISAIETDPNA